MKPPCNASTQRDMKIIKRFHLTIKKKLFSDETPMSIIATKWYNNVVMSSLSPF